MPSRQIGFFWLPMLAEREGFELSIRYVLHCIGKRALVGSGGSRDRTKVSADNLHKTGISAGTAGDFRQFAVPRSANGGPETKSHARKAGISGPISRFLGSLAERRSAWLATQW